MKVRLKHRAGIKQDIIGSLVGCDHKEQFIIQYDEGTGFAFRKDEWVVSSLIEESFHAINFSVRRELPSGELTVCNEEIGQIIGTTTNNGSRLMLEAGYQLTSYEGKFDIIRQSEYERSVI